MRRCFTPSSQHLADITDFVITPEVYCDGAYNITFPENWSGQKITVIHNCRKHDDWILLYLIVMKLGQKSCTVHLILPYISYGRQLPEYLATLLQPAYQSHVIKIDSFDLHQPISLIENRCLSSLVAHDIQDSKLQDAVLIAPDKGSIDRVGQVARRTGHSVIALQKQREPGRVTITSTDQFPEGKSAIIVDDMVDTGSTLKACATYLLTAGAKDVHVYATHGVLSYGFGDWATHFKSITFLNTLPPIEGQARWIPIQRFL